MDYSALSPVFPQHMGGMGYQPPAGLEHSREVAVEQYQEDCPGQGHYRRGVLPSHGQYEFKLSASDALSHYQDCVSMVGEAPSTGELLQGSSLPEPRM